MFGKAMHCVQHFNVYNIIIRSYCDVVYSIYRTPCSIQAVAKFSGNTHTCLTHAIGIMPMALCNVVPILKRYVGELQEDGII